MSNTDQVKAPLLGRLEALTAVAIVGVLALALGLASLVMPSSRVVTRHATYTQTGAFTYSASTNAGSVYGPQGLKTGEPIIAGVAKHVRAGFGYRLRSARSIDARGTASLDAVVSLSQGFSRRFVVAPSAPFSGAGTSISGRLPLAAITAYVKAATKSMGSSGSFSGSTATVTLRPQIRVTGTVGGHPLRASFSPKLPFTLAGSTLTVSSDGQPSEAADSNASGAVSALRPSRTGTVDYRGTTTSTVPLVVAHPSVGTARTVGFGLAGLCLLLGLGLAWPLLRSRGHAGERDRIRTLYGSLLVPVDSLSLPIGPIADVASIDALADLAKRYESRILHLSGESDGNTGHQADSYLVWDNGMLYRYLTRVAADDTRLPDLDNLTMLLLDEEHGTPVDTTHVTSHRANGRPLSTPR